MNTLRKIIYKILQTVESPGHCLGGRQKVHCSILMLRFQYEHIGNGTLDMCGTRTTVFLLFQQISVSVEDHRGKQN